MSFRTLLLISSMIVAVALFGASVGYTDHKPGHGKPGGKGDVDPQVTFEFFTCLENPNTGYCTIDTAIKSDGGGPYTGKIFMSGGDATISIIRSDRRIHITLSGPAPGSVEPGCPTDTGLQTAYFMNAQKLGFLPLGTSYTNLHFSLDDTKATKGAEVRVMFHNVSFETLDGAYTCNIQSCTGQVDTDDQFATDFNINKLLKTVPVKVEHSEEGGKNVWVLTPELDEPSMVARASLSFWKAKTKCNGGQFDVPFKIRVKEQ